MTPGQLLLVADEVCAVTGAQVIDFAALCAAAAAGSATIDGIPVHRGQHDAARVLARTILKLKPLSTHNDMFAAVAERVFLGIFSIGQD